MGGGPAGLLAAQRLAEAGHQVMIFEAQATVGRKFLVAGHGGFNLSNAEPEATFATRYGLDSAAFTSFLTHFSPAALRRWAADLGIETFVGTSGRIFPLAEHKPADLLRAWVARLQQLGVVLHTRHRWLGFEGSTGLRIQNTSSGKELVVEPQATLLALGGASWAKTGSNGAWVPAFESIGVPCVPFSPANCGAEVAWSAFFQQKVGRAPLKNIALRYGSQRVRGELMLTEYGVEGTPVYALTPALRTELAKDHRATLLLDLKPDLTDEQLLHRLRTPRRGKSLADFLKQVLHLPSPVPTLLREIAPEAATATPETLAHLLRHLPLPVTALRPLDEAISTAGGVSWEALTPDLMLRQRPGTFIAGEMLNWEAPTGGYLLQGCFSTGAWAAQGMQAYLRS